MARGSEETHLRTALHLDIFLICFVTLSSLPEQVSYLPIKQNSMGKTKKL